jgi:STE24 endopeptidase
VDVGEHRDAHGRRTIAAPAAAAALAAGIAWAAAAVLLLRVRTPPLELPRLDPAGLFPAAELARAERLAAGLRWCWVAATLAQLTVLALAAASGRRLASALRPLGRGRLRTGALAGVVAAAAAWVAALPAGLVAHRLSRREGLAVQGYAGWLADRAVGLAVTAALVAACAAAALWLARRTGRRWWLPWGAGVAALGLCAVLLQPVVLEPLTASTRPLRDPALAAEIERLAARLGVRIAQVEVSDASARTTVPNAQTLGIGPTRRVVLDDTLLDGRFSRQELEVVAAHELAHVARRHVWKGAAWFALLALPAAALVAAALTRRGDPGGPAGPGLVPLGVLCAFILYLATLPAQNAISRRYEAEADWLALRVTRAPAAAARLERDLAVASLADPSPPAWARILLGTHPTTLQRIAMARAFAAREPGGS